MRSMIAEAFSIRYMDFWNHNIEKHECDHFLC